MDFIKQLPPSEGFTAILVIVDRLFKQALFIPTHDTITSAELAKLFLLHIFSKHRVPAHVTSNQDFEFISHFFQSLGKALDMRLHFTSSYHPEGNGHIGIASSDQVQRQQRRDESVREHTHLVLDTLASRLRSYHLIVVTQAS